MAKKKDQRRRARGRIAPARDGIAARIDWLQFTRVAADGGDDQGGREVGVDMRAADVFHRACASLGGRYQLRPYHARGFEGLTLGGLSVSVNRAFRLTMLRGSGAWADWLAWQTLDPAWREWTVGRLDLCVDVHPARAVSTWVRDEHRAVRQHASMSRGVVPSNMAIIGRSGEVETLYVGSPRSDRRVRVYDKGLETGESDAGAHLRYEVVYRHKMSKGAWSMAREQLEQGTRVSVADWIAAQVSGECERLGLKGLNVSAESLPAVAAVVKSGTLESKLRWLERQVAPSVREIVDSGAVSRDEMCRILGL